MAKKILLLSDTHGFIDDKILSYCKEADEVWHAGDIGNLMVTDEISRSTPVRAVYGNVDDKTIRATFPEAQFFTVDEVTVYMTHIGGYPGRYEPWVKKELILRRPKLFIAGHSHILKVQYDKKLELLHMNPGAVGKHGFHQKRTMLRFEIEGKEIRKLEVIEFGK